MSVQIRLQIKEIDTPQGVGRAHIERATDARGTVVVSHGAGGGIEAPDLVALRTLVADGWNYVRVEQPWRVVGRKLATPPRTLDVAWAPIIAALTAGRGKLPGPLVVGGRSAGARVACRTAVEVGADVFHDEFGDVLAVFACKGAHGFSKQPDDVVAAVRDWLGTLAR